MQKNYAAEITVISVKFYFDSSELSKIFSKRMAGFIAKERRGIYYKNFSPQVFLNLAKIFRIVCKLYVDLIINRRIKKKTSGKEAYILLFYLEYILFRDNI